MKPTVPGICILTGVCTALLTSKVSGLFGWVDGDTTVSHGLGYLVELARAGRWLTLATEVRVFEEMNTLEGCSMLGCGSRTQPGRVSGS